jgi:hypothetical protein
MRTLPHGPPVNVVLFHEIRTTAVAMLIQPSRDIPGDADVERAVFATREDVDAISARCAHGLALQETLTLVVMGPGPLRAIAR